MVFFTPEVIAAAAHAESVDQVDAGTLVAVGSGAFAILLAVVGLGMLARGYRRSGAKLGLLPVQYFPLDSLAWLVLGAVAFVGVCIVLWRDTSNHVPAPPTPPSPPPPEHKNLLPIDSTDAVGVLLSICGLLLAAGGGIGGGGILVPLYILVFGFVDKRAIPLSNLTIFGGSIANCMQNWHRRHPWGSRKPPGMHTVDRPLIDFDLVLAMEPLTIAGAILGSLLNKLLPSLVVTVMLVVVLGFTALKTLKSAHKIYQKEVETKQKLEAGTVEETTTLLSGASPTPESQKLAALLEGEKVVPWDKILALVVLFIGCLLMNFLKGGPADIIENPLWSNCGGKIYWLMLMLQVPWCMAFALLVRRQLLQQHEARVAADYDCKTRSQFVWDNTTTVKYPLICSLAGLFAGLFGIGGGIVKGPLMLAMGVHPEVSSATAAFMIFFTTSSATLSYALFGLLTIDYGVVMFAVGFVATYVGQFFVKRLVVQTGHPSIVAAVIGLTVALSTVLMGYHGVVAFIDSPDPWAAPPLCTFPELYINQ